MNKIKNSFRYPFLNSTHWLILGIFLIIGNLMIVISFLNIGFTWEGDFNIEYFSDVLMIISVIVTILVLGYAINIIANSIVKSDEMPMFNIKNDFINGLKHILVLFVYFIVPILICVGVSVLLNTTSYYFDLTSFSFLNSVVLSETSGYVETLAMEADFTLNLIITIIISLILFFIFGLFESVAVCRLAKYGSLKESFNFKEVLREVKLSTLKLLLGLLFIFLISVILGFIFSLINMFIVPGLRVGIIISLIGYAYLIIFNYRYLGLLYTELAVK